MQRLRNGRSGWILALLFAGSGLLQAGCITFEAQTIEYQYDRSTDRMYLYSTFTGIFGDGEDPGPSLPAAIGLSRFEEQQLLNAAQGESAYFFDNWLLGFDVGEIKELLDDAVAAPQPADHTPYSRAMAEAQQLLVRSATVSNGPFFLDEQGRLSAVQRVTIRRITPLLKAFNDVLMLKAAADLEAGTTRDRDRNTMIAAAACGVPFLSLDGNQITIRWGADSEVEAREGNAAFIKAGAKFAFANGIGSLTFGRPTSVREKVTVRVADGYVPNAIAFVRAQLGIAEHFDRLADVTLFLPPDSRKR